MALKQKVADTEQQGGEEESRIGRDAGVPSLGEIGLNQFTPYLINRISARWNADLLPLLREKGLTTAHMRTLAVLSVGDGKTINELSVLTVTDQSTLSRALDVMEKKGLIERRNRADDARYIEVFITKNGRERFNEFWPSMHTLFQRMFVNVSPGEFDDFMSTLRKILNNIKKEPF